MLISLVSNIYPNGIQLRNLRSVSKVAWTSGAFWEFSFVKKVKKINKHLKNIKTLNISHFGNSIQTENEQEKTKQKHKVLMSNYYIKEEKVF